MNKPLLGAHVSAAGGLPNAITNAKRIGAQAIQIFGSSPRQYNVRIPDAASVAAYKKLLRDSGVGPVYLHAAYLVNLASVKPQLRAISIKSLIGHLKIAEMIGARGLIFHLGSSIETTKGEAEGKTIKGMHAALQAVPGKAMLLMENSSGGGNKLGSTIDRLAELFHLAKSPRVALCFDTAHASEAGVLNYSDSKNIKKFFDEWKEKIGFENLEVIHVNDSKTAFDSHHDRHENIGQGHIGLAGFKNLAREKRLWDKPWILEVPGFADDGPDKKNLELLRSCFI